jgi:glycosyltransferase involved in cell wall biosynthesis
VAAGGPALRLSAVIVAQDEAERLPACLTSLGFCDEIVVVDGGSRDGTRTLAQAAGARVLDRPFDDWARQREFGREQARGVWVLAIDADERASPALAAALRSLADRPIEPAAPAAFALPFQNRFRGEWLRHGGLWPDRHVRFFLRERCRYDLGRAVHERLLVDGATGRLDAPVIHESWRSLAHCLQKSSVYGERAAQTLFAQGRRAGAADFLLRPLWRFLRSYVLQLGFLDGAPGAAVAFGRAYETYARYGRLWELGRFAGSGGDRLR